MNKILILIFILLLSMSLAACTTNNQSTIPTPLKSPSKGSSAINIILPTPTKSPKLKASNFFVNTPNMYMKYKGTGNEYASFYTVIEYANADTMQVKLNNGGTSAVSVYKLKDGNIVKTYSVAEIYTKTDFTRLTNTNEIIIKEPIEVGTSWKLADGSNRSITALNKQVNTPLGKYLSLEVTTSNKDSGVKEYYAEGIGLIKRDFQAVNNPDVITSELEKIEK